MPANPKEALEAAEAISQGRDTDWGTRVWWGADRMRTGYWTPAQWYDSSLADTAKVIEDSDGLEPLADRHAVGPAGQRVQDAFRLCDPTVPGAIPGFHSASGDRRTIEGTNDAWYQPRPGKERLAARYLVKRSHLLLPMRFRTTNCRLTALWTPTPSFGWWTPVAVDRERVAQALAAWFNSTPGWLMLLNRRAFSLTYTVWQLAALREIRIPKPDSPAWDALAAAYAETCRMELLPMREAEECEARRIIDKAAALALDTDEAQLAEWRGKLAREPTVSNQPAPS